MKRLLFVLATILVALLMVSVRAAFTQTPKFPITYEGDTDKTIARRAQWIAGAKIEGKLVWWGTLRPNLANQLIALFNELYPFIKVQFWRGRGEEIATKLETEYASGRYSVDIMLGGETYNFPRWRKRGIITKFTDIIPGIEKIPQIQYGRFGDWFIAGNNAMTPQYNTNLVSAAEAPKSWEDLLDPKWKRQIGLTRDMRAWTTLALAEGGWGIEKTEDFLHKLAKQDLIWSQGHTAGHTLLIAGEFKLFAEELVYHTFLSQDQGAPVEWVRVNPTLITGTSYIFSSKSPHPNAARLFMEWQCSPQGLIAYENVTAKGSPVSGSGTRLSKALEGLDLAVRTEEVVLKTNELGLAEKFSRALGITN